MIFNIHSKNNLPEEEKVVERIKNLYYQHYVPTFTNEIVVEQGVVPHSHPVLTINTKHSDDRRLLQTILHEQFHWYLDKHPEKEAALDYLKSKYPDDGETRSFWEHIIICFNTRNFIASILSPEDIKWAYEQFQPYPKMEKFIENNFSQIKDDLEKFNLILKSE
jgi:hypothetical protein